MSESFTLEDRKVGALQKRIIVEDAEYAWLQRSLRSEREAISFVASLSGSVLTAIVVNGIIVDKESTWPIYPLSELPKTVQLSVRGWDQIAADGNIVKMQDPVSGQIHCIDILDDEFCFDDASDDDARVSEYGNAPEPDDDDGTDISDDLSQMDF